VVDERLALLRGYCADVAREIHFGLQIDRNPDSVEQWLDHPAVHVLRGQHADMGQHRVTDSFGHDGIERAGRCRAQPGQQHSGGFAARVTLLGAERPVRVQQRRELVGRRCTGLDKITAGTHDGASCLGMAGQRCGGAQPVEAHSQVVGDHMCVAGIGLRAGEDFGLAPGPDRVGFDRQHRVPDPPAARRPSGRPGVRSRLAPVQEGRACSAGRPPGQSQRRCGRCGH
jgi:hypothetical protein